VGHNYSPETLFEVVARGGDTTVSYATCDGWLPFPVCGFIATEKVA